MSRLTSWVVFFSEIMIGFSHFLATMASTKDNLKTERKPTKGLK